MVIFKLFSWKRFKNARIKQFFQYLGVLTVEAIESRLFWYYDNFFRIRNRQF